MSMFVFWLVDFINPSESRLRAFCESLPNHSCRELTALRTSPLQVQIIASIALLARGEEGAGNDTQPRFFWRSKTAWRLLRRIVGATGLNLTRCELGMNNLFILTQNSRIQPNFLQIPEQQHVDLGSLENALSVRLWHGFRQTHLSVCCFQ